MSARDFAADKLAAILRQPPRQVVLTARARDGRLITVVVASGERGEASDLIERAGWSYVDITAALSLADMRKIVRAAR